MTRFIYKPCMDPCMLILSLNGCNHMLNYYLFYVYINTSTNETVLRKVALTFDYRLDKIHESFLAAGNTVIRLISPY